MPPRRPAPDRSRSVIHDLGYRPYAGPRLGEGAIARSLVLTGFRNAFGLGRSGKSKALPFILLALNLFPAVILVGVMVLVGLDELPIGYAAYASTTQVLLGIFVAAQAPVLFSRDLRHGSIALYLARPLRASTYAIARWTSLLLATFVFLLLPVAAAVRRRGARRARLHRADRERRQGTVLRRPAGPQPHRDRGAHRVVVDPARLRGRRHHRRAAHRQRHRHRHHGHRRGRGPHPRSARSPGCSRRTPSTAAASPRSPTATSLTPPTGAGMKTAYLVVFVAISGRAPRRRCRCARPALARALPPPRCSLRSHRAGDPG